jgi:hypothetical protein
MRLKPLGPTEAGCRYDEETKSLIVNEIIHLGNKTITWHKTLRTLKPDGTWTILHIPPKQVYIGHLV